jgi:NAD(P)H-hydrate epimerase
MKLLTVDQMRSIETAADASGHTFAKMMDLAGNAVAQVILAKVYSLAEVVGNHDYSQGKPPQGWSRRNLAEGTGSIGAPSIQPPQGDSVSNLAKGTESIGISPVQPSQGLRILFLIGPGNNGGDGLVAARVLKDTGADIGVYLLKARDDELIGALRERNVFIANLPDDRGLRFLHLWLSNCAVIVDALLGTGTARPISGDLAKLLTAVNAEVATRRSPSTPTLIEPAWPGAGRVNNSPYIVAVDGPTGLNYDTGELDQNALTADISVTFAYPKIGHTQFPGARAVGELIVADIGIDPKFAQDIDIELADANLVRALLPARPLDAHKGTFGKLMVVAGSIEYTGAPILAATAAYRSGAGLVTLATPKSIHSIMASKINEATFLPLLDQAGALSSKAVERLVRALKTYDALLIGPGLSLHANDFIEALLGKGPAAWGNAVIDADALNILATIDQWWTHIPALSILTPHPGEMSRLTKMDRSALDASRDRVNVARKFAATWGQVIVLKGAFTIIAAPDNRTTLLPFANPALATAGSGDVLAGSIAAMRAQGLPAYEAAIVGAYLHGLAGEIARREMGSSGVMAGDLLDRLPRAIALLKSF